MVRCLFLLGDSQTQTVNVTTGLISKQIAQISIFSGVPKMYYFKENNARPQIVNLTLEKIEDLGWELLIYTEY